MNKVELEFKRIQSYLFASPRLRAMLGANSFLGRTVRLELTELARDCNAKPDQSIVQEMPEAMPDDPLRQALVSVPNLKCVVLIDDPAAVYRENGVMVRDGGHFIATFADAKSARNFVERAYECITERLPGILVEARIDGERVALPVHGESLFQHSGFQVSRNLGNRPAEKRGIKGQFVSAEEQQLEERGRTFRDQPTDLIGILEQAQVIPCADEPPQSLTDITGQEGYLALIHADGNSVGKRYGEWQQVGLANTSGLAREAHGERIFHSMRVAVRRALVQALEHVFKQAPQRYQLLMLGGDDLLLACSAELALPFVCAYAKALDQYPLCDGAPLSIGAGVAIAKASFPFHRLHSMAEALADSAKQRFRAEPDVGSVVDWHISTNAWVDDPIAERRAESLTNNAVLSNKPYPVQGKRSLAELIAQTEGLKQSPDVARSQLRRLVEILRQGPHLAELGWLELPTKMRLTLAGNLRPFDHEGPFRATQEGIRMSVLPDLVELLEIDRLGKNARPKHTKEAV